MTFDAINTTDAIFQEYQELSVLLGPEDGSPPVVADPGDPEGDPPVEPTPADTFEGVRCVRVVQSAGGSRLDYADLVYALTASLEDRVQPSGFARMVHVRLPDDDETLLHAGDYVRESAKVEKDGESLTAQSQLRPYHFGLPLHRYIVWNPIIEAEDDIQDDVVFNPVVDGEVQYNQSDKFRDADASKGYIWAHPELASSTVGETYQDQVRSGWTLQSCVHAICNLLNNSEAFILNPTTTSIDVLAGAPLIRNVRIPLGTTLEKALDMLLVPLGYNHWIDYETDEKPTITLYQIGVGTEKELKFQSVGETLDLAESNVNQFSTDNAIGDSFNQVTVYGQFEEGECTFPVFPAWDPAGDSITPADLAKDGAEYPTHQTAWRLFIANEAGDVDPETERLGQMPVVPDLTDVFANYIPHRRALMEPLTYLQDEEEGYSTATKQRMPHVVEYSIDSGVNWLPAEESWTIKLCPNQIGILFDGNQIPQELYDAGDSGRLRITGTIYGDSRVYNTALKESFAANGRVFEQLISRPDKFQSRFRNTTGDYASVLTGDADEVDHNADCLEFAEEIRDRNHYAEIDCEFRLPGLHLEYKIGDLITKIAGREISLDAAPTGAPSHRYVQIVERRWEYDPEGGPSTVLIVDRGLAEQRQ